MNANQESLFENHNKARYGDNPRHQNLFLPRFLAKDARNEILRDEAQETAFKILKKWADLEFRGKLQTRNEEQLKAEFLTEIFGKALGYALFSDNTKTWEFETEYSVNGGTADGAIGVFESRKKNPPVALVELKGPTTNLDRDRFNGRTAVQQCWDYLNARPDTEWGIISNYVSFRIYHRAHGSNRYQLFIINEMLKNREHFEQFYYLMQRDGLLQDRWGKPPRALTQLQKTTEFQREIGDELYSLYALNRIELIQYLEKKKQIPTRARAIKAAQKLLNRIIFVAFCEDRELLPRKALLRAWSELPPFARVTNPRWQNFLKLFESIDKGNPKLQIPPYNGGLFAEDPDIDALDIDDDRTNFFKEVGEFNFSDEVNVEVLGHFFEKSVHEIEQISKGGLFDSEYEAGEPPKMEKSAERKRHGIFYTPKEFTEYITRHTVGAVIDEKLRALARSLSLDYDSLLTAEKDPKIAKFWKAALDLVKEVKIVDPACGSGAFLISAYDLLFEQYKYIVYSLIHHAGNGQEMLLEEIPDLILKHNLYGVDLSEEAVEITKLALWLRSAVKGKPLTDLSQNIVNGNSLVSDKKIDPISIDWKERFPEVFNRQIPGFDSVIGNPPWERLKLQEREFFDGVDADIATAVNAATRNKLIDQLKKKNPDLYDRYCKAKEKADSILSYIRKSGKYPLTGIGDINTYAVFAELAYQIVAPSGHVGLLVPSGIATDDTTKEFFAELIKNDRLTALFDFENKAGIFQDVHRSFKFSILLFTGGVKRRAKIDFAFFLRDISDITKKDKIITLKPTDFQLINPNTLTCPIFRSPRDAELTKAIYKRVPILIDHNRGETGNPWGVKFLRMFDQTNDAGLFRTAEELKKDGFKLMGNIWQKGKKKFLPLYEAKMIQMYDHRAASIVIKKENWFRQGQPSDTSLSAHQNPEFCVVPRWWADSESIKKILGHPLPETLLAFKNVTSPTNQRTMIATFVPSTGVINSAPLILFHTSISPGLKCCFLANLNSIAFDYVVRQKIGNVNLNFFIIEQLPMFSPDAYDDRCPWQRNQKLSKWISDRVLKLTCTSNDMIPLAKAAGFEPPVHKWKIEERADIMAQLDAAYFLLYGIVREDVEYILSTFQGIQKEEKGILTSLTTKELILKHYDSLRKSI